MTGRARSLIDSYRGQGNLIDRARSAAAQILNPDTPPPPAPTPERAVADSLAGACTTIVRRDLDLIDTLLTRLEQLAAVERDPDKLATLYGLDHLATRLRRNAEALRVLSGEDGGDARHEATPLLGTIRAALSSIEFYQRVSIGRVAALAVVGSAADDVSRLLAELLDNATIQSQSTVVVSAHLTEKGSVLVRVEDEGVGLSDERLAELNAESDDGGGIGLAVVRRLALRHGIEVRFGRHAPHGTTASALLPAGLVRESPLTVMPAESVVRTTAGGLPRRIPRKRRTPELSVVEPLPDRGQFMADLVALADGERAARIENSEGDDVGGE
ncbi:MAG TPA: ATP-binding protein [Pseudonocardiaceae bacterium]|jgi:signal transduction histidine kinase|nr:ATP-binding protein [Pseudonocardiaceae bacterium]